MRIYDSEKRAWVNQDVYLSLKDDVYVCKKGLFGKIKLIPDEYGRYIVHKDIDLYDKNGVLIHEGDYIKAEVADNKIVTGIVAYASELSAYIILCFDIDEYYTLGSDVSNSIEVIGNVFDNKIEDNLNNLK